MENMLRTAILTGGLVLGGLVAYKAAVQSVRGTAESKNPAISRSVPAGYVLSERERAVKKARDEAAIKRANQEREKRNQIEAERGPSRKGPAVKGREEFTDVAIFDCGLRDGFTNKQLQNDIRRDRDNCDLEFLDSLECLKISAKELQTLEESFGTGGQLRAAQEKVYRDIVRVLELTESENMSSFEILERAKKAHESGRKINWKDIVAALCGDG